MSENDQSNQQFSHNVEVALAALQRICTNFSHISEIRDIYANQEHMIDFDFQIRMIAANTNRQMNSILHQICIYQMMKKSKEFEKMYMGLTPKGKAAFYYQCGDQNCIKTDPTKS